nr:immunoglobulin light chain junction region [Macaca mulatta]MOW61810.1 immunoglobulin light chain junction region [Macaca mulatta]MOW62244.1 immunoglobulin light chain junction region [Macaca mulatta]MOW62514.1 immunoglobulin light chain junction region [Macaca mulatta]MOW62574.1 immunoglobulin light chain junction region [Macaca mulatta]
CQQGYNIPYTF